MAEKTAAPSDGDLRVMIGDRVRRVREAMGLTQEAFGELLGVYSKGTQSKIENGGSTPGWDYLWKLEHRFHVPITYFWYGSLKGVGGDLRNRLSEPDSPKMS